MSERKDKENRKNLFLGLVLVTLGALFLLDNLYVLDLGSVWQYWPFIIVAFGLQKLFEAGDTKKVGEGIWLAFLGLWLYVSLNEIWGLGFRESWPALIIAWGIGIVWRSFGRPWPMARKDDLS